MNITGPGRSQPPNSPAREPAARPDAAEAWRQAMLSQILAKVREHEPAINQAAGRPEPEPSGARKGSLINLYI